MDAAIGFLLGDTARLFRREFGVRARQHGITALQWRLIMQLKRGGSERQSRLADLIEVEPITLSRMVDRLVESGLVERKRDPADHRAWTLHLTRRVDALVPAVEPLVEALYRDALGGIEQSDREVLHGYLVRVQTNLSRSRPPETDG